MSTFNPSIFTLPFNPSPSDSHPSATLEEQLETEQLISSILQTLPPASIEGVGEMLGGTTLRKAEHAAYFQQLFFRLPPGFVALDASKPWLMYWTVHSLDLLGIALDQGTKDRAISTMMHMRHPTGGFSGGPSNSQIPHLLATYASTCTLAIVGNDGPRGGWQQIAEGRQTTYDFFMRCKRPDGGFVVCSGGELDVRGTYCLLVVATLLDIITPELIHNVDQFISACQTYEGGFACSSFPFPTLDSPTSRAALAEAHGGYTSCALNSHFLLSAIKGIDGFPSKIDVDGALRWSAQMQGEAMEGGGFRGRSNKLVDGCYSWWVGGGVPVLEALSKREKTERREKKGSKARIEVEGGDEWVDDLPSPPLFNKIALQEYILIAAQSEPGQRGGLRDKPGKRPDQYHTCNNLSGLSVAQHTVIHSDSLVQDIKDKFDTSKGLPPIKPTTPQGGWASEEERQRARRDIFASALGWVEEGEAVVLGGRESRVNTTAPVFNILLLRLKPFIHYLYGQTA